MKRIIASLTFLLLTAAVQITTAQETRTIVADFTDENDFWPNIAEVGKVITYDMVLSEYLWEKDGVEIYFPLQPESTRNTYAEYRYTANGPFLQFRKYHEIIFRSKSEELVSIEFVPRASYFNTLRFSSGAWNKTLKVWTNDDPENLEVKATVESLNTEYTCLNKVIFTVRPNTLAAIESIESDDTTSKTTYYNLQGIELREKPTRPGLYIRRCGNKVDKIIIH